MTCACLWMLGCVIGRDVSAQESGGVPEFPASAEIITVDTVVLDDKGLPVRGLSETDFALFEDGKLQEIVAFAARDLGASRPDDATVVVGLFDPDEEVAAAPGRIIAFIVDDLGLHARCVAAMDSIEPGYARRRISAIG